MLVSLLKLFGLYDEILGHGSFDDMETSLVFISSFKGWLTGSTMDFASTTLLCHR